MVSGKAERWPKNNTRKNARSPPILQQSGVILKLSQYRVNIFLAYSVKSLTVEWNVTEPDDSLS